MPLPFEFVVTGAPVSQQARRRELVRGWGQEVQRAASLRWDTEPVAEGIMVIISYFFDGEALDVDNVPKPILDAMSGLVFADDAQVTDLLCRKRDVKLPLDIDRPSPLLLGTFDRRDEFLHVLVTDTPTMEVAPW